MAFKALLASISVLSPGKAGHVAHGIYLPLCAWVMNRSPSDALFFFWAVVQMEWGKEGWPGPWQRAGFGKKGRRGIDEVLQWWGSHVHQEVDQENLLCFLTCIVLLTLGCK